MNAQVAKSLRDDPDKSDIIDRIPTGKYALFLFLTGLVAITLMLPLAQVIYLSFTKYWTGFRFSRYITFMQLA
jgi:ABC-type spermidine/putrescine transport system permease subunit II